MKKKAALLAVRKKGRPRPATEGRLIQIVSKSEKSEAKKAKGRGANDAN